MAPWQTSLRNTVDPTGKGFRLTKHHLSKQSSSMTHRTFRTIGVLAAGLCCLTVFAGLTGCGPAGAKNSVSGAVTVDGSPVVGTIHFVGADGKSVSAPVGPTGGAYTIADPPLGEVTVLIKPSDVPLPAAPAAPPGAKMPEVGGKSPEFAKPAANPPAKYAEASGGLKYTVVAGHQKKDFALTP